MKLNRNESKTETTKSNLLQAYINFLETLFPFIKKNSFFVYKMFCLYELPTSFYDSL